MPIKFKCPVCGSPLEKKESEKRFLCCGGTKQHSFDIARQGYVNLLLPQKKGTALPGDNKMMVNARTEFLDAGYYQPFSDALNEICREYLYGETVIADEDCSDCSLTDNDSRTDGTKCLSDIVIADAGCLNSNIQNSCTVICGAKSDNASNGFRNTVIADAGCGEGYYTKRLASAMPKAEVCGFDLSRDAIAHAAQSARAAEISNVSFGVASLFEMPLQTDSCHAVCCLFAPVAEQEFARILKKDGILILGVPGEEHLWGLKSAIYDKPYLNSVRRDELGLFEPLSVKRVEYDVTLRSNADIMNLFRMTPYFWKTSEQDVAKLSALSSLVTKLSFDLLVYKKK